VYRRTFVVELHRTVLAIQREGQQQSLTKASMCNAMPVE
jgi:hypothetical protein